MLKVRKIRINFSLIALAVILTITFFVLFLGNFKYYRSEVSLLFIPKSERFAVHTPYILENLEKFPKTLAFYEKMLKNNKELSDQLTGQSKDDKKKEWNKMLSIKKDNKSSIIEIALAAKNENQSLVMTKATARTLIDTASFYYNIKTDADFRIIEEPNTTPFIKYWYWLVLISIILGISVSLVLDFLFSALIQFIRDKKNKFQLPLPSTAKEQISKIFSEKLKRKADNFSKRSSAPENLPIAQSEEITSEERYYSTENENFQETEKYSEPTERELKERLNQLLRGEI